MQDRPEHAVLGGCRDDAAAVTAAADPAERHRETALRRAAAPGIRLPDHPADLRLRYIPDPAHLSAVAVPLHSAAHLPHVPHRPALQREVRDVDDCLVAKLKGGQPAFAAPDLRAEFTAADHCRDPGVPRGLVEEGVDRAWPGLCVPDGVAAGQHHAGQDPVADAGLAGRRPDDPLVVAEREVTERVPVSVLGQQIPDLGSIPRGMAVDRLGRPQEQVTGEDQREQPQAAGQEAEEIAAGLRREDDRPGEADHVEDHGLHPLEERVIAGQPAGDRKVREADGDVRHQQSDERPERPPPGERIAYRVELTAVKTQDPEQRDGHGDRADMGM